MHQKDGLAGKHTRNAYYEWNNVVFGSLWRLFLLCIILYGIVFMMYVPTAGISKILYFKLYLLRPVAIQAVILLQVKIILEHGKEMMSQFLILLLLILLTNAFMLVIAFMDVSIYGNGIALLLPLAIVPIFREWRLFPLQLIICLSEYLMVQVNSTSMMPQADAKILQFVLFVGYMAAFAIVGERIRKSTLLLDIQSWTDSMTHMYNHQAFYDRLTKCMQKFEETGEVFSILIADIDDFKKVNDTYGHVYGDEVICTVTQVFDHCKEGNDFVARYGGEEFAMILPGQSKEDAIKKADCIRREFSSSEVNSNEGPQSFTISIGVAEYNRTYESESHFFNEADQALYRAKNSGKNKVCCN